MVNSIKRALVAVGVALVLPATPGCRSCTEAGCQNGVILSVDGAWEGTAEVCVEGRCGETAIGASSGLVIVRMPLPEEGTVAFEVDVRNESKVLVASDRGTATITPSRPNGDNCPPLCHQVRLWLGPDGRVTPAT